MYLNPLYLEKRSFAFRHYTGKIEYFKGLCPITENLHEQKVVTIAVVRPPATIDDMADIVNAIKKILDNKEKLKE